MPPRTIISIKDFESLFMRKLYRLLRGPSLKFFLVEFFGARGYERAMRNALLITCSRRIRVLAFAAAGLSLSAWAAVERFPFVIPGDDATPSVTDMSKLSPKAAGADGFVRAKDGHLATDSRRLKIWGVNTCFDADFPTREEAEKVAAHMAKLGINGVRVHHHETAPSPRGLLGPVENGKRHLDPQQLERQDYFLDQLHKHGIYVDLNLHVGRSFTEAEGFAAKDLPRSVRYDKYILYFEPRMRVLFKEFCRDYLNHLEEIIRYEGPETIAAVLIESVTGTNGVIIPPDGTDGSGLFSVNCGVSSGSWARSRKRRAP